MFRLYFNNVKGVSIFRPEGVFTCEMLKESVLLSRMMEKIGQCSTDKIVDCRSISVVSSSFMELYPFLERLRIQSDERCARMAILIDPAQQELAYFIRMAKNMLSHRTMKIQVTYEPNEACEWLTVDSKLLSAPGEMLLESGHCVNAC